MKYIKSNYKFTFTFMSEGQSMLENDSVNKAMYEYQTTGINERPLFE